MYDPGHIQGVVVGGETLIGHAVSVWPELSKIDKWFFVKEQHPTRQEFLLEPGDPNDKPMALFRVFSSQQRAEEYVKYLQAVSTGAYVVAQDTLGFILGNTWAIFEDILTNSDGPYSDDLVRRIIVVSHTHQGLPYSIESVYDSECLYH